MDSVRYPHERVRRMVNVTVERDYLIVATEDWQNALMERDDALTDSLRDWLEAREDDDYTRCCPSANYGREPYHRPDTAHIIRWAGVTFRADDSMRRAYDWWEMTSGLYGDNDAMEMHTYNYGDNLLSADIGAVWFHAPDGSTIFVETANDRGEYIQPIVYRVTAETECLLDYSRAYGGCVNHHSWETEDGGVTMHDPAGYGSGTRIDEYIRQAFGKYYVACPTCGKSVHFSMDVE